VIEFEHILCPIDFSDTSIRALTYAAAFADWYEAQLEVLHVVPAFEEAVASGPSGSTGESSHPTSRDAVLRQAVASKVDLVVMGAQGTAGLELMVYGSNTQHVVRAATCPVLTVHA